MKFARILAATVVVAGVVWFGVGNAWWWNSDKGDKTASAEAGDAQEIGWEDLVPDDFQQPENPFRTMTQAEIDRLLDGSEESNEELARLEAEFNYAPVVPELDGKRVKLATYITPLDFDGQMKLEEFLMVPYMGACIHTPPPPANQIVHAFTGEAIELDDPYSPVVITGVIKTETVTSDLAEAGYTIAVERIDPYVPPVIE